MAAPRIPTPFLERKVLFLTTYEVGSNDTALATLIAASQTDQIVSKIVLPCPCQILRIDYSFLVAGSTHTLANIEPKVDGTAIASVATAADTVTTSMEPTTPFKTYDQGSVFTLEVDTNANSTITSVAVTLTILPVHGQ